MCVQQPFDCIVRHREVCTFFISVLCYADHCRRLGAAERTIAIMKKAWALHLPNVDLEDVLQNLENDSTTAPATSRAGCNEPDIQPLAHASTMTPAQQHSEASPTEASNVEDYEFDESQDFDNTTDGMGFLIAEPGKAGYMGPQSGVAAVKFLQSLHLYSPISGTSTTSLDELDTNLPVASSADIANYMNDYFAIYHTAYPILHEGTFRARVSGMC